MPELRKDPVIGRWVIIAVERARRPGNFVDRGERGFDGGQRGCALCHVTQKAVYTAKHVSADGCGPTCGDVRVVSAADDAMFRQNTFHRTKKGLYDVIDNFGQHETVIETPAHVANMADLEVDQIRLVFEAYAARLRELEKNIHLRYALAYKSYGSTARDHSIGHCRSYVVGSPVRPLHVKEKLIGAKRYFDTNQSCVYCDLIRQETKDESRVICESGHFLAVVPFAARFLFEIYILPKSHHCDYSLGVKGKEADLAGMMKRLLQKLRRGLDDPAYNFVVQTAPFRGEGVSARKWGTIAEDYHWHIELMPRLTRSAGFEKGTGFHICSVPPEDMAEYLREVNI